MSHKIEAPNFFPRPTPTAGVQVQEEDNDQTLQNLIVSRYPEMMIQIANPLGLEPEAWVAAQAPIDASTVLQLQMPPESHGLYSYLPSSINGETTSVPNQVLKTTHPEIYRYGAYRDPIKNAYIISTPPTATFDEQNPSNDHEVLSYDSTLNCFVPLEIDFSQQPSKEINKRLDGRLLVAKQVFEKKKTALLDLLKPHAEFVKENNKWKLQKLTENAINGTASLLHTLNRTPLPSLEEAIADYLAAQSSLKYELDYRAHLRKAHPDTVTTTLARAKEKFQNESLPRLFNQALTSSIPQITGTGLVQGKAAIDLFINTVEFTNHLQVFVPDSIINELLYTAAKKMETACTGRAAVLLKTFESKYENSYYTNYLNALDQTHKEHPERVAKALAMHARGEAPLPTPLTAEETKLFTQIEEKKKSVEQTAARTEAALKPIKKAAHLAQATGRAVTELLETTVKPTNDVIVQGYGKDVEAAQQHLPWFSKGKLSETDLDTEDVSLLATINTTPNLPSAAVSASQLSARLGLLINKIISNSATTRSLEALLQCETFSDYIEKLNDPDLVEALQKIHGAINQLKVYAEKYPVDPSLFLGQTLHRGAAPKEYKTALEAYDKTLSAIYIKYLNLLEQEFPKAERLTQNTFKATIDYVAHMKSFLGTVLQFVIEHTEPSVRRRFARNHMGELTAFNQSCPQYFQGLRIPHTENDLISYTANNPETFYAFLQESSAVDTLIAQDDGDPTPTLLEDFCHMRTPGNLQQLLGNSQNLTQMANVLPAAERSLYEYTKAYTYLHLTQGVRRNKRFEKLMNVTDDDIAKIGLTILHRLPPQPLPRQEPPQPDEPVFAFAPLDNDEVFEFAAAAPQQQAALQPAAQMHLPQNGAAPAQVAALNDDSDSDNELFE